MPGSNEVNHIIDRIPGFVCRISPDYSIDLVNSYFIELFGEPAGRKCYEIFFGLSEPCEKCPVSMIFRTEAPQDWKWISPDERIFLIKGRYIVDGNGAGKVLEIGVDITEEEGQRQKIEELQYIIDRSPAVVFLWKAEENWPVEMVSENISMFGYTPDDFLSGRILYSSIIHPDDLERITGEVEYNSENRIDEFTQHYRILGKDGKEYRIDDFTHIRRDSKGRITHYQGIILDITQRKRVEEALQESEATYRTLFENAGDAIFTLNDKVFLDCNRRTESMFGAPRDRIIGRSPVEFSPERQPDGRLSSEKAQEKNAAALSGKPQSFEWVHKRPDGTLFYVEVTLNRIVLKGEYFLQAIVRDINERKEADEKIEWLSRFPSENPNPVIRFLADGTILYANEAGRQFLENWKAGEGDKMPDEIIRKLTCLPEKGCKGNFELISGGTTYFFSYSWIPDPGYTNIYGVDITEKKKAENELHSAYERLSETEGELRANYEELYRNEEEVKRERDRAQQYLDIVGVIVVAIDAEGKVTQINKKGCEVLGYTEDEVIGTDWFQNYLDEEDLEEVRSVFNRLMSGEIAPVEYVEKPVLTKGGEKRIIAWHNAIIKDDNGSIIGTLSSGDDITDKKKAESSLEIAWGRYSTILDALPDIMFELDSDYRIIDFRAPDPDLLYVPPEEFLGKRIDEVLPPHIVRPIEEGLAEAAVKGQHTGASYAMEIDGVRHWYELSIALMGGRGESGSGYLVLSRDITDRKESEEEIRHLNRVLYAIRNINQLIILESDKTSLLQKACRILTKNNDYHNTWIVLLDREGRFENAFESGLGKDFGKILEVVKKEPHEERCIEILGSSSVFATAGFGCGLVDIEKEDGEKFSSLTTRMEYRDRIFGALSVSLPRQFAESPEEQGLIREIAGDLAFALYSIEQAAEKKQAEEDFIRSEVRFRELFNNISSGVAIYRPVDNGEDFEFVNFNRAAEEIEKLSKEDVIGRRVTEVFPAIEEFGLLDLFREVAKTGKPGSMPITEYKDNRIIGWRENRVYRLPSGEVVAVYDDITEKKIAEESIKELSTFREKIIEDPEVWVVVSDMQGKILLWNEAAERITGYKRNETLGTNTIWKKITPNTEDRKTIAGKIREIKETGEKVEELPFPIRTRYGYDRYLLIGLKTLNDSDGNPYAIVGIGADITERKQAQEALAEERWRLKNIIEGTHAGTWEWNIQTGETIFNERWAEIIGYTLDELSPTSIETWEKFAHPDDLKRSGELLEKHFAGELDYYDCEARMKHKDGHWVWVLDRGRLISRTEDGKPLMMLGTHIDITELKAVEEELRESEELYRTLAETSPGMIYLLDTSGTVKYLNSWAAQQIGKSPDEIVGKKLNEIFTHKTATGHMKAINAVINSGKVLHTEIFEHFPTGDMWIEVYLSPVLDKNGSVTGVLGISNDISDRKLAENELKLSRMKLAEAMDLAHMVNWEYDVATGMFTFDDRFYTLYGTTAEREGGNRMSAEKYAEEFVYPDDRHVVADEIKKALETTDSDYVSQLEHRVIRRDGEIRDIVVRFGITKDENGRTVKTHGANQDITERKRAEDELERTRTRLEKIVEFLPDATFVVDDRSRVIAWNNAIEEMTGVDEKEIIGKGGYQYSYALYREKWPLLVDYLMNPDEPLPERYSNVRRGPDSISAEVYLPVVFGGIGAYVLGVASVLYDEKGNPDGAIESIRDITELKNKENELVNSLAEKNVIINEIHHRVKNNLQIMSALIQMQESVMSDEIDKNYLDDLNTRILSMARVYETLYDTGEFLEIDMKQLVDDLISNVMLSYPHKAKITMDTDITDEKFDLNTAVSLSLILSELFVNVIKHAFVGRDKGHVLISLQKDETGEYKVIVSDDGVGYRGDPDISKAKTLGMKLLHIIVKRNLHGDVKVTTDGGTTFIINFRVPVRQ